MQVKSIAECSKWSILQYFSPSLTFYLPLRSLFCLFLSGHLSEVLLYNHVINVFYDHVMVYVDEKVGFNLYVRVLM